MGVSREGDRRVSRLSLPELNFVQDKGMARVGLAVHILGDKVWPWGLSISLQPMP